MSPGPSFGSSSWVVSWKLLTAVWGGVLLLGPGTASWGAIPEKAVQSLATLERGWVENRGQWHERVAFAAPGYFASTWVTPDGELWHLLEKRQTCEEDESTRSQTPSSDPLLHKACPSQAWVLSERWVGGKVQALKRQEELETRVSYVLGSDPQKHRAGLPTYRYLSLGEVWPGVEVKLKASQKTVEKLFDVAPGADLSQVRVELKGARRLRLAAEGEILVETSLGEVKLSKPVAWQEKDGKKLPVQASYRLWGKNQYGFLVENADPTLPLVIDPILQSTYLGGSERDYAYALKIAPSGEVYVAGWTFSTNFPNTVGGAQPIHAGSYDAFVARLNSSLTSNLQSTYLGGSDWECAYTLAIASNGEVYVAGLTASSDYPNTSGGAQPNFGGGEWDAFVARLNNSLTTLLQTTYLGGSQRDAVLALALSPSGEVYVAGSTQSSNFPNTSGGTQPSHGGGVDDGFVSWLSSALTSNVQSTFLGGTDWDYPTALAIAPSGEVYVAGRTASTDFPNTGGGAQPSFDGVSDAFVARLSGTLASNLQTTYLGGSDEETPAALAIAASGQVYLAGFTGSANFPNTTGGAQASRAGPSDAFVARLNSGLTANLQSTYLGGSDRDYAYALEIAPSGEVYVAGRTTSSNFPNTGDGAQPSFHGVSDAFVARLSGTLASNPQTTYLGGSQEDAAFTLGIAPSGEVYVAGLTGSSDFPRTSGGAQGTYGGSLWDAFVGRLTGDLQGPANGADLVASNPTVPWPLSPGASSTRSFSCTNAGNSSAFNATCSILASAGLVSGVTCSPPVPVSSLAPGASIHCSYSFTAPGTAGGSDTGPTGVTFTVNAGATNDSNPANNSAHSGWVPLVDAVDDLVTLPPGGPGNHPVGANDQVGAGLPPSGSSFTYLGGSCASGTVTGSGVASFVVPDSGSCTVNYRLCLGEACDTATLTVSGTNLQAIPTLGRWGMVLLGAFLVAVALLMLRRPKRG